MSYIKVRSINNHDANEEMEHAEFNVKSCQSRDCQPNMESGSPRLLYWCAKDKINETCKFKLLLVLFNVLQGWIAPRCDSSRFLEPNSNDKYPYCRQEDHLEASIIAKWGVEPPTVSAVDAWIYY